MLIDFHEYSVSFNIGLFVAASAVVWLAGTRLATYADIIAEHTGIGEAFAGLILLALATSLPELTTTITASVYGNASLAAGNLLGGVAMQTAVIAIADIVAIRGALTFFTPRPTLLLQGSLLVLILVLTIMGATIGDLPVLGVGLWTSLIFGVYLMALFLLKHYEANEKWRPIDIPDEEEARYKEGPETKEITKSNETERSTWAIGVRYGIAAIVILIAGVALTRLAEAIGVQTGIGSTFVGATLLALATSLPELSTTIGAVKLGAASMAISNVFGSNAVDTTLLFVADIAYQGEPVLSLVGPPAIFLASVGIVLTIVYIIGLIERRDQSFLRGGLDSLTVLAIYFASLTVLYFLG